MKEKFDSELNSKKDHTLLYQLYNKDKLWPAVLAARVALRVFPLIGNAGTFDFWSKNTNPVYKAKNMTKGGHWEVQDNPRDNRSKFLLEKFLGCQQIFEEASQPLIARDLVKLNAFASASGVVNNSHESLYHAPSLSSAKAALSSAFAVTTISDDADASIKAAEAAYEAAHNAFYMFSSIGGHSDAGDMYIAKEAAEVISSAWIQDLKLASDASDISEVINLPLWHNKQSSSIDVIFTNAFKSAVLKLANEVTDKDHNTGRALRQLIIEYELVNTGNSQDKLVAHGAVFKGSPRLVPENTKDKVDKLGRTSLINGLTLLLTNDDNTEHSTIGLMGHWGCGKTRILDLLRDKLKKTPCKQNFLFGEFNAWAYEHSKNSQAAMAHEVIKALTTCPLSTSIEKESTGYKKLRQSLINFLITAGWNFSIRSRLIFGFAMRKYPVRVFYAITWAAFIMIIWRYLPESALAWTTKFESNKISDQVTWFGPALGLLLGIWQIAKQLRIMLAQPMTKEFLTYLKLPDFKAHIGEITEMQQDIQIMATIRLGAVDKSNFDYLGKILPHKRLMFVVDDLDRCSPEGIVKTFEAIRLVLDIPQVTVVVAVDQRVALAALALHYEKIQPYHTLQDAKAIARDYLAKMILLPIVVSDVAPHTLGGYLSHLWQEQPEQAAQWQTKIQTDIKSVTNDVDITPYISSNNNQDQDQQILTEAELVKMILNKNKSKVDTATKVEYGLSLDHKAAFFYWATEFGLSNARQLKRLHNSYNLLRLVSDKEDQLVQLTDESTKAAKFGYRYLVTLMALEFINCIEVTTLRLSCSYYLRTGEERYLEKLIDKKKAESLKVARNIIEKAAELLVPRSDDAFESFLAYVENFVLPAIDGIDIETEYKY